MTGSVRRVIAVLAVFVLLGLLCTDAFAGETNAPSGTAGGCGGIDREVERQIVEALLDLSVEVANSSNCGGGGADGSFFAQSQMPEFCGEYEVCVRVEGSVETKDYGYDEVFLSGMRLFGSEGRNVDCGMKSARGSATIVVQGGDTVTLAYSTNDGLHHVGAYARVVSARIVGRPSCSSGGSPGTGGSFVGCAGFSASLGHVASGRSAGLLSFEYDLPCAAMAARAGLSLAWAENDASVAVSGEAGGVPVSWDATDLVWRAVDGGAQCADVSDLAIRRVAAPECVVDLADVSGGYEIRYYLPGQLQDDTLTGEPYLVWRIRNASTEPEAFDKLEVSEIRNGSAVSVALLEYDAFTGDWSRTTGTGASVACERTGECAEGEDLLRFREIRDASGNVVSYKANLCRVFPWGEEVVEERDGIASPRVTTHSFYDDADADGDNYGLLKQTVSFDGSWTRFEYDAEGRIVREVSPWLDASSDAENAACKVVECAYSEDFPQTTEVTRIAGVEVSRTYSGTSEGDGYADSHTIRAAFPGAAWDASGNVRSFVRTLNDQSSPFHGTILVSVEEDGTGSLQSITPVEGGQYSVTVEEGRLADPWLESRRVVSGTRTASVCGADGRVLSSSITDSESGIFLWTAAYSYDSFGRRLAAQYSDGTSETTEYGCCGPVRTVSRDGTEVLMGYTAEGRLSFRTSGGITTLFSYDAAGRAIAETALASDGTALTSTKEYDEHGDLTATVFPGGRRTEFSRSVQDGHWTQSTVNPDGGTEVVTYNRDGSIRSESGTAVVAMRYVYGVAEGGLRTTRTIWPDAQGGEAEWMETTRDFLSRSIEVAYPDGTHSTTAYDEYGRVMSRTSPAGRVTLREYDHSEYGDITAVDMDGDGEVDFGGPDLVESSRTHYVLLRGRPVKRVESWRFEEANGTPALVLHTDTAVDGLLKESASGSFVAKDEVLFRGKSRILRKVTSTNGTVVEQEWLNGQLRRTSSELEGTTDYAYDGFGRRSRITTERNGVRLSSLTTYDADGNAVSETVMSGGESRTLRRTLDKAGRVIREEMLDGSRLLFQYDLQGNLVLESGDAQRVAYAYDHRNRRISMTTWRDPFGQGEGDTTRWSYDECGRMVRKAYADGTHVDYTYDADSNELSRTSARGIVRTSSYDAAGRRVAVSYSDGTPSLSCAYDRAGRLVRVTDAAGTWTLAYDANGNCISESVPQVAGRVVSRIYDALNRPAGLSLGDGENADLETAFSYDALGRLASVYWRRISCR